MAPRQRNPPLLHPLPGRQALSADNQRQITRSRQNSFGCLTEHLLGGGSTHVRKMPAAVLEPEPAREAGRRIVVCPAHAKDNVHVVYGVHDPLPAAIQSGALGHFDPQLEGLGRIALFCANCPLGNTDQTGRTRIDQRPLQRGGRFSANALGPSLASSLWKTRLLSSASTP